MNKLVLIVSFLLGFGCIAKGDTIDYWHVFYNKQKIKEYNQYSNGLIQLEISEIRTTDTMLIYYFQDAPCNFCENMLIIEDGEQNQIFYTPLNNYPAAIPLKVLLNSMPSKSNGDFSFFYRKDPTKYPLSKNLLFRVKIH